MPARVEEGTSTYAFGWNVAQRNGDTLVWHTGNSGGQRAFLGRRIGDRITVIILTQGDSRRPRDRGRDRRHPAPPAVHPSAAVGRAPDARDRRQQGCGRRHRALPPAEDRRTERRTISPSPSLTVSAMRCSAGATSPARSGSSSSTRSSSPIFECLRQSRRGLRRAGRGDDARKAYSRAVELDPGNGNAQTMLKKLK